MTNGQTHIGGWVENMMNGQTHSKNGDGRMHRRTESCFLRKDYAKLNLMVALNRLVCVLDWTMLLLLL